MCSLMNRPLCVHKIDYASFGVPKATVPVEGQQVWFEINVHPLHTTLTRNGNRALN